MNRKLSFAPFVCILMISCGMIFTKTDIRSYKAQPEYNNKFSRVLVDVELDDVVKKDILEKNIVIQLQSKGVMSSKITEFLNPFDKDKEKKLKNLVKEYGIEGLLKVRFVSEKLSTQVSSSTNYDKSTSISSTTINETSLQYELFETKNWASVWQAGATTTGANYFEFLAKNSAAKIVEQLKADGLI